MSDEAKAAVQAFAEMVIAELEKRRKHYAAESQIARRGGNKDWANTMRHVGLAMDEAIEEVRRLASEPQPSQP